MVSLPPEARPDTLRQSAIEQDPLVFDDTIRSTLCSMGLSPTLVTHLPIETEKKKPVLSVQSEMLPVGLQEAVEKVLGRTVALSEIRRGRLERIFAVDLDGYQRIIAIPSDSPDHQYTNPDKQRMFNESLSAMQKAHNVAPWLFPKVYHIEYRPPFAVLECIRDGYEEVNIQAVNRYRLLGRALLQIIPLFLTESKPHQEQNNRIILLTDEELSLFTTYIMTKVYATRILMSLTTIHGRNPPIAFSPARFNLNAGDLMLRINEKRQAQMRPITFRGGVNIVHSLDTLIDLLLSEKQTTALEIAHNHLARFKRVPLIPNIPHRQQWLSDIASWVAVAFLEKSLAGREISYKQKVEAFCGSYVKQSASSPFTPAFLLPVAQYFGNWLEKEGKL